MKSNQEFRIVDEGIYMLEKGLDRWAIRHPTESYSPNKTGLFEIYIESLHLSNIKPKFIGYSSKLVGAKEQIFSLISAGKTYNSLANYYFE